MGTEGQLEFGGLKSYTWIFDCASVWHPSPHLVQGPNVYVQLQ